MTSMAHDSLKGRQNDLEGLACSWRVPLLGNDLSPKKYQPPRRPRRTEKVQTRLTSITMNRDHEAKVKVIIQTDNQIITYSAEPVQLKCAAEIGKLPTTNQVAHFKSTFSRVWMKQCCHTSHHPLIKTPFL